MIVPKSILLSRTFTFDSGYSSNSKQELQLTCFYHSLMSNNDSWVVAFYHVDKYIYGEDNTLHAKTSKLLLAD